MTVYLDTSVVVPLLLHDTFSSNARAFLAAGPSGLLISDFVVAEFASVVGIRVRMKILSLAEARTALSNLDLWIARNAERTDLDAGDIRAAEGMLRRLDLTLRAPDAINLAVAQRLGAELATFDARMADCARKLGISVINA